MRTVSPATAFTIALVSFLASAQAAEISAIKAVGELSTLAPITLTDGRSVRIGLADSAEGPWKMLYCLAEVPAGDTGGIKVKGEIPGEILGPVFYTCSWDDQKATVRTDISAARQSARDASGKELFYAMLPLAWNGVCHIRVMNRAGEALLTRDITVAEQPVCYWQTIAASDARPTAPGPYPLELTPAAAVPSADGMWSSSWADIVPATQPARPAGLSVQLDQCCFIVRAEGLRLVTWPRENLLARWWVNGKPVIPPRSEEAMAEMGFAMVGRVDQTHQLKIAFGLPTTLGTLHAGDRVDLQLLYVPGGDHPLLATAGPHNIQQVAHLLTLGGPALPTLSNRMTFVITEELLAASPRK